MRSAVPFLTLVALTIAATTGIGAQQAGGGQAEDCIIDSDPDSRQQFYNQGEMVFFGGGATFICRDGRRIRADSVEQFRSTGISNFIGRVRYSDRENILTANYVRYMERERQATAQGNVVLTERESGSVIRGPFMHYYQESRTRPESWIQLPQGRPHAVMLQVSKTDSTRRDTTVVDADGMDIIGRGKFTARGNVILTRGDLQGTAANATYDREGGDLRLWGTAKLQTPDYTLTGDTITGTTNEEDELERVTAIGTALLDAEEVDVKAPHIVIEFENGEVHRLIAVGTAPKGAGIAADPTRQAVALSEGYQITADSLDALAPERKLEQVVATGRAYGERLNVDLGNANVPAVAARDWMRGDTIITKFVEAAPDTVPVVAKADTTPPQREVESVLAIGVGERASSLYRIEDKEDPSAPVSINYTLARRIHVQLKDGAVASVNASMEVQGLHLEPFRRSPGTPVTTAGRQNGRGSR